MANVTGNEKKPDAALDSAADSTNDKTDGKRADKVEKGRDLLDSKLRDK